MGKRGSFLELDQFFSWDISLFAQTSVLDLCNTIKAINYK
jgi:hypothetical protein